MLGARPGSSGHTATRKPVYGLRTTVYDDEFAKLIPSTKVMLAIPIVELRDWLG